MEGVVTRDGNCKRTSLELRSNTDVGSFYSEGQNELFKMLFSLNISSFQSVR